VLGLLCTLPFSVVFQDNQFVSDDKLTDGVTCLDHPIPSLSHVPSTGPMQLTD